MNLAKLTYLAVTVGLVVLTVRTTSADSKVDCSSLKKWSSDSTYKKGDMVRANAGVTKYDAAFQCTKSTCHGAGDNQPYFDNGATWKQVGVCK